MRSRVNRVNKWAQRGMPHTQDLHTDCNNGHEAFQKEGRNVILGIMHDYQTLLGEHQVYELKSKLLKAGEM